MFDVICAPPAGSHEEGVYTFVSDGIESALPGMPKASRRLKSRRLGDVTTR
jgi:hypothetical protein